MQNTEFYAYWRGNLYPPTPDFYTNRNRGHHT